jgi:DNA-binding transcriptional LysR family regulator
MRALRLAVVQRLGRGRPARRGLRLDALGEARYAPASSRQAPTQGSALPFRQPTAISLILNVALCGLGLAYLPEDVARQHVGAGRLVKVLTDWSPVMTGYHLYYPNRQPSSAFALLVEALPYRDSIYLRCTATSKKRISSIRSR